MGEHRRPLPAGVHRGGRLRVLLVADFYPPEPGGLEAHARRLARALITRGHDVAVATVAGGAGLPAMDDGVRVARWPTSVGRLKPLYRDRSRPFHPPWPDPAFTRRLGRLAAAFRPDVVHAHGWCAFSALAACRPGAPLVVTLHDYGLRCPKKTLLRGGRECATGRGTACLTCPGDEQGPARRAALAVALAATAGRLDRGVARYLAVSEHVAARHVEGGLDPARVRVVPNFLDMPASAEPPAAGDGPPAGVLYVGPAAAHKGRAVLLQAHRRLPAGLARLVVAGDGGPDTPGVEYAGRLDGDALWARYRAAAVVVVPSVWPEPCPTVALEAMGWGRPLVASRTGGLLDLVADGDSGVLVPPGDPAALAAALRALLEDGGRRRAMGTAALARAQAFSTDAVVPRIEATYREVASREAAATAATP
jgi:glycosyltransferase involved in cell wall biosynthesis